MLACGRAAAPRPPARGGRIPDETFPTRTGRSHERWVWLAVAAAHVLTVLWLFGPALFDGRLAAYKHPREVVVTDALPRNAMGKVLKYVLRERFS